ncbi:MAG: ATP-binding protein [Crenarchaeota archaeon]|nr:ATP-binding protein [Thermoproteota archaeon]MCR8455356.1 ATP-binding protein [Thermoproteota archaeon]
MDQEVVFPFVAFVGQDLFKLALLAIAVNPSIGGLLVRGEKGTGKSVLVRALADVLLPIEVVADCPFNCDPHNPLLMCPQCRERYNQGEELPVKQVKMKVITLPIGATEDMVLGTIDIEKVLKEGKPALKPGILARANRNILYIDEINLLPDHLVDIILDAAAMGFNYVERENISFSHPAKFILVGTMNPEEGDIRPQLLDRLSLCVDVKSIDSPELRAEIIKRNMEFQLDPIAFRERYKEQTENLRNRIAYAKSLINSVKISDAMILLIAKLCSTLEVDGHRPDIVIAQTARALAALDGRDSVEPSDIQIAAQLALIHRTRKGGLLEPPTLEEIEEAFKKALKEVKSKLTIKIEERYKTAREYIENILLTPIVPKDKGKVSLKGEQHFFR